MEKGTVSIVTGGAGFIGSHLCDALIASSQEVYCIDNLITGNKRNISHLLSNPLFHFIKHDVTNPLPQILNSEFLILNSIYHLASPASPPKYRQFSLETLRVNSQGTYNMLELAKKYKAKFLLASTSEVYGDPKEHPQKENYWGNVNPVGVRSCYDEGKRFAESLTMAYVRKFSLDGRIIRIFNTYGPRMDPYDGRIISNFICQAIKGIPLTVYGSGSQTRSFCFIDDLVNGLIKAAEKENIPGAVINLGYPQEHTVSDIAQIILNLTGSNSKIIKRPLPQDDPARRLPNIEKAKKLLGWEPKVPLEKGLIKTIKYFKQELRKQMSSRSPA